MNFINKIIKRFNNTFHKSYGLGISSKDKKDDRDFIYCPDIKPSQKVKSSGNFTLKNYSCNVLNQQKTSSCTGHAGVAAMNIILSRFLKVGDHQLNPWFIYYFARKEDNTPVSIDGGATMRSLLKALKQYGVYRCKMDSPYSIPENIDFTKCFYISNYYRCNNDIEKIKYALENDKLPVLICFKVFYTDIDNYHGIVGMYDKREQYDGYHAICLTGYTYIKNKLYFQFQNSWGKLWGENGFGYISEDYIKSSDLVPDIWIPTFIKS